jgi:hypothetical protein
VLTLTDLDGAQLGAARGRTNLVPRKRLLPTHRTSRPLHKHLRRKRARRGH